MATTEDRYGQVEGIIRWYQVEDVNTIIQGEIGEWCGDITSVGSS